MTALAFLPPDLDSQLAAIEGQEGDLQGGTGTAKPVPLAGLQATARAPDLMEILLTEACLPLVDIQGAQPWACGISCRLHPGSFTPLSFEARCHLHTVCGHN